MNINEFENLATEFIEDCILNNLSNNTIDAYKYDINDFLCYCVKNKMNNITTARIKSYLAYLKKNDLSSTSMKRRVSTLSRILDELFPKNINIKMEKPLPDILSDEEIKKIQNVIQNEREYLIINTLLITGMRISELWALNKNDIEKDKFKITGKGSKDRLVYITNELYKSMKQTFKTKNKKVQPLIVNNRGERLSKVYIRKIVNDVIKRAKIDKNITPHSLRHTFATKLLESGVGIRTVQKSLGHENINTTARYTHLADQIIEKEIRSKNKVYKMIPSYSK